MEPITAIVSAIGTLLVNGFFEKGGADLMNAIREKLKQQGTDGLLKRAENQPTERNVQILEAELVTQIDEDKEFEKKVRELVEQLKKEGVIPDNNPAPGSVTQTFTIGDIKAGTSVTFSKINKYSNG